MLWYKHTWKCMHPALANSAAWLTLIGPSVYNFACRQTPMKLSSFAVISWNRRRCLKPEKRTVLYKHQQLYWRHSYVSRTKWGPRRKHIKCWWMPLLRKKRHEQQQKLNASKASTLPQAVAVQKRRAMIRYLWWHTIVVTQPLSEINKTFNRSSYQLSLLYTSQSTGWTIE